MNRELAETIARFCQGATEGRGRKKEGTSNHSPDLNIADSKRLALLDVVAEIGV